jgi:hypothetical protein
MKILKTSCETLCFFRFLGTKGVASLWGSPSENYITTEVMIYYQTEMSVGQESWAAITIGPGDLPTKSKRRTRAAVTSRNGGAWAAEGLSDAHWMESEDAMK